MGRRISALPISRPQRGVGAEQINAPDAERPGRSPVAHIVAGNSGLHAKDAPSEGAGWLARKTYICRGARRRISPADWMGGVFTMGEIGDAVDIIHRTGGRPPWALPACVLVAHHKYCGPVFLPALPNVSQVAPYRAHSRFQAPLLPDRGTPCSRLGPYCPQNPRDSTRRRMRRRVRGRRPIEAILRKVAPVRTIHSVAQG